jgi:Na+-driven multidrug efflux pump
MVEAMAIMGGGTVVNIILDPIMIGPMGLGIDGAAWATIISQVLMAAVSFAYFARGKSSVPMRRLRPSRLIQREVFSVGVSAMAMQVMMLVQQTLFYKSIAAYGSSTDIAVAGSAMRMMSFAFIPVWGMSQGLQPIVGMNYGAENYRRVKMAFRFFTLAGTAFCTVAWIAFMAAPNFLLGMFVKDAVVVEGGASLFRLMLSSFFLSGFMIMSITLFQATGKGGVAALLVSGRQLAFFAPLVLLLPLALGLSGVFLASPVADLLTNVVTVIFVTRLYARLKIPALSGKGIR